MGYPMGSRVVPKLSLEAYFDLALPKILNLSMVRVNFLPKQFGFQFCINSVDNKWKIEFKEFSMNKVAFDVKLSFLLNFKTFNTMWQIVFLHLLKRFFNKASTKFLHVLVSIAHYKVRGCETHSSSKL